MTHKGICLACNAPMTDTHITGTIRCPVCDYTRTNEFTPSELARQLEVLRETQRDLSDLELRLAQDLANVLPATLLSRCVIGGTVSTTALTNEVLQHDNS